MEPRGPPAAPWDAPRARGAPPGAAAGPWEPPPRPPGTDVSRSAGLGLGPWARAGRVGRRGGAPAAAPGDLPGPAGHRAAAAVPGAPREAPAPASPLPQLPRPSSRQLCEQPPAARPQQPEGARPTAPTGNACLREGITGGRGGASRHVHMMSSRRLGLATQSKVRGSEAAMIMHMNCLPVLLSMG